MHFVKAGALTCLLSVAAALGQQPARQSRGVPARSAPTDYAAHIAAAGATYAAALIPSDEVKHIFAFDISKSYVVFEVAIYPGTGVKPTIDPENFVLRTSQSGEFIHPADSDTVASVIQQKNLPRKPSNVGPVVASEQVGYESGRDPYTGQRVHGTYTDTQVGVSGGRDAGPPPQPTPGGSTLDREMLEGQLWEKSLPSGDMAHATAGYLYFPSSLVKKKSNNTYELQYLGSDSDKVQLSIPAKSR